MTDPFRLREEARKSWDYVASDKVVYLCQTLLRKQVAVAFEAIKMTDANFPMRYNECLAAAAKHPAFVQFEEVQQRFRETIQQLKSDLGT